MMRRYWSIYGGWRAILASPYLHLAIVIEAVSAPFWLGHPWWDLAVSVEPSFLGFSLACYALLVGLGDERFRRLIAGTTEEDRISPFMGASATFAHFILVQAIALILALLAKALDWPIGQESSSETTTGEMVMGVLSPIGWAIGYLAFCYSITLSIAAMIAIFRLSTWFDRSVSSDKQTAESNAQVKVHQSSEELKQ